MFERLNENKEILIAAHVILLAIVLIPFLIWGEFSEQFIRDVMAVEHNLKIGAVSALLLALDPFLPVPSSAVSVTSGLLLGMPLAFASCLFGLTVGCLIAYYFGQIFRRTLFDRFYEDDEFRNVSLDLSNYGMFALIALRGVPVLSELSVMAAGFHRYSVTKFFFATLFANTILAGLYTYLGDTATELGSISLFIAVFLCIPLVALTIRTIWLSRFAETEGT